MSKTSHVGSLFLWLALVCSCAEDAPASPASQPPQGDGDGPSAGDGDRGQQGDAAANPGDGDGDGDESGDGNGDHPGGDDAGEGHGAVDGGDTIDGGSNELDAPADSAAYLSFLEDGKYKGWAAEPDYHASTGPHGGAVRVFYSPRAAQALKAGKSTFPKGAATVKELTSEGSLYGWAVWTKVQDDSAAGDGFYWYEIIRGDRGDDEVYGDGLGHSDCVYCHEKGRDFLLSDGSF